MKDAIDIDWEYETYWAIVWALGLIDDDISNAGSICDCQKAIYIVSKSKNLEDFEHRLNDPENRISNLDLNNDGYVDFLRVVEVEEKGTHLTGFKTAFSEVDKFRLFKRLFISSRTSLR